MLSFLHITGVRIVANDSPTLFIVSRGLVPDNRSGICITGYKVDDT